MARLDRVALHLFVGFEVDGVQVQAVRAGQQAVDHVQVAAQLVGVARLAGVVAGGGDPAGQFAAGVLEPADIIALPAVQGDGNFCELPHGGLGIHTQGRIAFLGNLHMDALDHQFGWLLHHGDLKKYSAGY